MKNDTTIFALLLLVLIMAGCKTNRLTERERFERSVLKELPFSVDSMSWLTCGDLPTLRFANAEYADARPDAEIRPDGDYWVCNMFDAEPIVHQKEENIWRNVLVSRKHQRVVCIDRYLRKGRTMGYCYILQSERKEYPTYGTFHWDVSDSHNIEMVGTMLDNLKELALKRCQLNDVLWTSPVSQYDYWRMIFHADSLFDTRLYDEARQVYDLAFSDDRYILPSQLSTTANKMTAIGDTQAALTYLRHRLAMEKDFYEDALTSPYTELRDTFKTRSRQWQYNLELKKTLESIFERDQYYRLLWSQAVKNNPDKFPAGYVFDLSKDEIDSLKSKFLILDEGGRGQHSKRGYKALTERGLYMLATILKGETATRATLAIIETYAQVRSMVRDMEVLQSLKDGSVEQATQLTKAGHKLADLIGNNLSTESTKTTIELNLAVLKITHEVTRTKRRK